MNVKELDLKDLKAMAYEQIVLLEQTKRNIQMIEEEIIKRNNKTKNIKNEIKKDKIKEAEKKC